MSASKSRKARAASSNELTAQPKDLVSEISELGMRPSEPGISVDADELGAHFLREATAAGEVPRNQPEELSINRAPDSDDPLLGPNFDADHSVWEQTVDLSIQRAGQPEIGVAGESPRAEDMPASALDLAADGDEDELEDALPLFDQAEDEDREGIAERFENPSYAQRDRKAV